MKGKQNPNDYVKYFDEWAQRDLKPMILRNCNHPSIIIWKSNGYN
jgi:beta-galactosidase